MIARITLDFCHVDAIIKAEKKKNDRFRSIC